MLDYGVRSKCCFATVRLTQKKIKGSTLKKKVWLCNKCGSRDVNIVTKSEALNQESIDSGN